MLLQGRLPLPELLPLAERGPILLRRLVRGRDARTIERREVLFFGKQGAVADVFHLVPFLRALRPRHPAGCLGETGKHAFGFQVVAEDEGVLHLFQGAYRRRDRRIWCGNHQLLAFPTRGRPAFPLEEVLKGAEEAKALFSAELAEASVAHGGLGHCGTVRPRADVSVFGDGLRFWQRELLPRRVPVNEGLAVLLSPDALGVGFLEVACFGRVVGVGGYGPEAQSGVGG
jgi:hypothetical protein